MAARLKFLTLVMTVVMTLGACKESQSNKIVDGTMAPDFTLSNLEDQQVSLSSFKGKTVVVRFWSDWCAFCKEEMSDIQLVYDDMKDKGLVILAVNVGQDRQTAHDFVTGLGISYPTLLDEESKVTALYGVIGLPTTFFVDFKGVVRGKILGEADEDAFQSMVRKAML